MLHKTLLTLAAAVALCVPMATNALADGHPGEHGRGHVAGRHVMAGPAPRGHVVRYGGGYRTRPIYDSCRGYGPYGNGGCPGYGGVPLIDGLVDGVLGGYGPY